MDTILFVMSATVCINYSFRVVSTITGNQMAIPMPIGHLVDICFAHTYVTTPAVAHQIYFWAMYAGIFNA